MLFWIIALVLTLLAALTVVRPLLRSTEEGAGAASSDMAIYKDQLTEVERDLARGVLAEEEAERARTEIARRLLAADREASGTAATKSRPARALALAVVAGCVALAGWLYYDLGAPGYGDMPRAARIAAGDAVRSDRPSQTEMEAAIAEMPRVPVQLSEAEQNIVDQLRAVVRDNPDELQGWTFLVNVERDLENYAASAAALNEVIRLKGEAATESDYVYLLDLMVAATLGQVSPEAEALTRFVLTRNESNLAGRYYLGLLYAQTDRPDIAFRLWRDVVENGDLAQIHVALAREQIEGAAFLAGVEYTLPTERGPTAEDMAAAADMAPEDQQAMIEGMVAQLSDRLATEGGPASDWARLITAHGVLGNLDQARAIWTEAQVVFATRDDALATLRAAAEQAGVAE